MSGKDPGVGAEPHLREDRAWRPLNVDPSEAKVAASHREYRDDHDSIDDSVFDEPWMRGSATPERAGETYAGWVRQRLAQQNWAGSLGWTIILILAAGPFAILAALYEPLGVGVFGVGVFLLYIVIGPTTEEMAKIALLYWTIERRPYRLLRGWQILLIAAAGGLVFATIENMMYLFVYIPDPSPLLVMWRLVICTLLHVGCSLIAGVGMLMLWRAAQSGPSRPDTAIAFPYLVGAIVAHGIYNAFAILIGMTGLFD